MHRMSQPARRGVVVRVDARQCEVLGEGQEKEQSALLRGRLFGGAREDRSPLAVGDQVELDHDGNGLAIAAVLPRRNSFSRRSAGDDSRRQVLAANVDQIVLVACFGTPPFSSLTTDRIMAAASFARIPVVLVLNKIDLTRKRAKMESIVTTYRELGLTVVLTNALDGSGVDELAGVLDQRTSLLYGLSGVGKSSLLNLIEPGLGLRTREVSKSLHAGRHTTTYARLYPLADGGAVIDTPGVRTFRPYGIPPRELWLHYPEMARLGNGCRYHGCSHRHEPSCRVREAVENEELPASRYRSYLELLGELEEAYGRIG